MARRRGTRLYVAVVLLFLRRCVGRGDDILSSLGLDSSTNRAAVIQMRSRLKLMNVPSLLAVDNSRPDDINRVSRAKVSISRLARCLRAEEPSDCILLTHPCIRIMQHMTHSAGASRGSLGGFSCQVFLPSDMSAPQSLAIAERVVGAETYFEWGGGSSTELLGPLALRAYTAEHYAPWCNCLRMRPLTQCLQQQSPAVERITCVRTNLNVRSFGRLSVNNTHKTIAEAHRAYVHAIDLTYEKKFDVLLIDGRAHFSCALKALGYATNSSVVFVNEWPRKHGRHILQYYDLDRTIDWDGKECDATQPGGRCLAQLRPKRQYCGDRDVHPNFLDRNRNFVRSPVNF